MASWLALSVPLMLVGLIIAEAAVPAVLGAQSDQVVLLGRIALFSLVVGFYFSVFTGVLGGDQDFVYAGVLQTSRLVLLVVAFIVLWALGAFTVTSALVATMALDLLAAVAAATRALRRHGLGRPEMALARETLWYGFRSHGQSVGGFITGRLDLFIMPSVLVAADVGLYSVATNVSSIVGTISSFLPGVVLPLAVRRGEEGPKLVVVCMWATLVMATVAAAIAAICATFGVRIVYGADFEASVLPLQILLPGTIATTGTAVLAAGLGAIDRPFTAGLTQLPGVVVTVVGLLLFLRAGGVTAAAVVSSVSYVATFVTALVLYKRGARLTWRQLLPEPSELARLRHPRALFAR